ncbi:butyrophilin-like protein 8 [Erinaceus europaeus]|uniref:Butyrophilin-like protein 8 n=1 Tax=Erinaceus europaeus TaxID=9365 RepID=A0ABM3XX34_ERIEU|nr:butyrophilin-like protein 8 [Erinaceus europaeus]
MPLLIILILSFLKLGSGQWQVTGPDQHVQVLIGEDAVFTCFLSPETSAETMEVRFFKNEFSTLVHLYKDGKDKNEVQTADYKGRTELVKNFMAVGHVSLKLKNVTTLDAGLYGCLFSSEAYYQDALWELQVSALGLSPLVSIMGKVGSNIQLLCKSSGWFPQPTVKWKNSQGHDFPSDSKVNVGTNGLFDVESSIVVQENTGSISCSIQHPYEKRQEDFRILIKDTFFQSSPLNLVYILLGVICLVCIIIISAMTYCIKRMSK